MSTADNIEWNDCENPRCKAKVALIGGQIMQREWSQNGARMLGYRFHQCAEHVPESQPVTDVYYAKWARKGNPHWFRYVGPQRKITTGLLRPPDTYAGDYERYGSVESVWERVGIYKGTVDWKEMSSDEIYAEANDDINRIRRTRRNKGYKNDDDWNW